MRPCCFGEIESRHQSFVLCFIVGGREVKVNHAFDLVPFRREKYDTCTPSLPVGRPVCIYTPLWTFIYPLVFPFGELCYEVRDDLPFDGSAWAVLNVKLAQLYFP